MGQTSMRLPRLFLWFFLGVFLVWLGDQIIVSVYPNPRNPVGYWRARFDPVGWRTGPGLIRSSMAKDICWSVLHPGMAKAKVLELLGKPEKAVYRVGMAEGVREVSEAQAAMLSQIGRRALRTTLIYNLGRYSHEKDELSIILDSSDKVVGAWIPIGGYGSKNAEMPRRPGR